MGLRRFFAYRLNVIQPDMRVTIQNMNKVSTIPHYNSNFYCKNDNA